jgi:hypothetical protein
VKNAEKREHKKETENEKRESKKKNSKIKRRKTQVTGEQRGFFL